MMAYTPFCDIGIDVLTAWFFITTLKVESTESYSCSFANVLIWLDL